MPNQTCTQLLKVAHLRVLRLTAAGLIEVGADARYEHSAPIALAFTEQRAEREQLEQRDGNGDVCGAYNGPPGAVDRVDLSVDLCTYDAELIEMLAGGTVITDGSYGTIGYLAATDADKNVNGVAIEAWSIAWNGRQRALRNGQPAWYRHVFPKTTWQVGEVTMNSEGFSTIPLTGVGEVNSGFGTGLVADPWPVNVGDHPWGWHLDDAKPTGMCGYQTVAA